MKINVKDYRAAEDKEKYIRDRIEHGIIISQLRDGIDPCQFATPEEYIEGVLTYDHYEREDDGIPEHEYRANIEKACREYWLEQNEERRR